MKCRQPGCTNEQPGRFEGFCSYCIGQQWVACKQLGCDQYTLDKSHLCFMHRDRTSLIGATEAAEMLGVSTKTVQRMANDGQLPCIRTQGGHRKFKREELARIMEEQ